MPDHFLIKCACGRKHKLSRGENEKLRHEVIEPETPPEPKPIEKPKEGRSLLDVIFGDD